MSGAHVRFAVVGGGVTGLAAAHRLAELAHERGEPPSVVVLESSGRFGGQVRSERHGEFLVEGGADSFLSSKPAAVDLCARIGLGEELVRLDAAAGGTRILHEGQLVEIPAGFVMMAPTRLRPFLRSALFSPWGKLRILSERLLPAAAPNGDESLAGFVRRRFGREALDRVAEPVLASLYMADAEKLSMTTALARFVELERSFGSVTRGFAAVSTGGAGRAHGGAGFSYLRGGCGQLIERLAERLGEGSLRAGAAVISIGRGENGGGWHLRSESGAETVADAVVFATPAPAIAAAVAGLDAALAADLGALDYASCATVNLIYRAEEVVQAPQGLGFFVPRSAHRALLACSFASRKFPGRAPQGSVVLRCFLGGALHPEVADLDEAALGSLAERELGAILGLTGRPLRILAARFPGSMPQYPVGFPDRWRRIRERVARQPGLVLAGSAAGAVGIPDCVRSGEEAAAAVFADAGHATTANPGRLPS